MPGVARKYGRSQKTLWLCHLLGNILTTFNGDVNVSDGDQAFPESSKVKEAAAVLFCTPLASELLAEPLGHSVAQAGDSGLTWKESPDFVSKISPCENPNSYGELQHLQNAPKTEPSASKAQNITTKASFGTSIWNLYGALINLWNL